MDVAQLQAALAEYFAPWVHTLELEVRAADTEQITLRLPHGSHLARTGGMVCGQALMAAADTAVALAVFSHFGAFRPCTTVQMNSSFLRPLVGQDGQVQARLVRVGKALAFAEVDIAGATDGKSVCRVSATYALL
jgi:uncharacterized protein (TIGR00369 family)